MSISSLNGLSSAQKATPEAQANQARRRVEDAATQFEALMVAQLLEPITKMNESDSSTSSVLDMGKEQLAQAITSGGGLGLRKTILASLTRVEPSSLNHIPLNAGALK